MQIRFSPVIPAKVLFGNADGYDAKLLVGFTNKELLQLLMTADNTGKPTVPSVEAGRGRAHTQAFQDLAAEVRRRVAEAAKGETFPEEGLPLPALSYLLQQMG